jgi:hypothetical protein
VAKSKAESKSDVLGGGFLNPKKGVCKRRSGEDFQESPEFQRLSRMPIQNSVEGAEMTILGMA